MFSASRRDKNVVSDFEDCLGWIVKPNPSGKVVKLLLEDRVRRRAFELWKQHGRPEGRDVEFWLQAEQELRAYMDKSDVTGNAPAKSGYGSQGPRAGRLLP